MDKKLMEALQAALKVKGLNEGLTKFITVTKEDEIEGAIADFLTVAPSQTNLPVNLLHPDVVKAIDQARTQAVATSTANLAKKYNFDPTKEPGKADPPTPPADETPKEKELREKLEVLTQKFDQFSTGLTLQEKQQKAADLLRTSKIIPDAIKGKWTNRFDVNSEVSLEDQFKALEDEYTEIDQTYKNSADYAGQTPTGFPTDKATQAEIDAIVTL